MKKIILFSAIILASVNLFSQQATAPNQVLEINAIKSNSIISVNSNSVNVLTVTLNTSGPNYTIGEVIGDIITFSNVVSSIGKSIRIERIFAFNDTIGAIATNLLMFNSLPTGTITDNQALVLSNTNGIGYLDLVSNTSSSLTTTQQFWFFTINQPWPKPYVFTQSRNLYIVPFVAAGATGVFNRNRFRLFIYYTIL